MIVYLSEKFTSKKNEKHSWPENEVGYLTTVWDGVRLQENRLSELSAKAGSALPVIGG